MTFWMLSFFIFRELREKDEIEKYRMERPKIQQQFSDLKVYDYIKWSYTVLFLHLSLMIFD